MAWLKDLAQSLPAAEREHWRSYNIAPDGVPSRTFYIRNIRAWFADPTMPDLRLKMLYPRTNEDWRKNHGWPLWHDPEPEDEYVMRQLHVCLDENQSEFDQQNGLLAKAMVDFLNVTEKGPVAPPGSSCMLKRNGKVATRDDQLSLFDFTTVSEKIYLTQYGLMAERHWREFRPKMVRELEAKGHVNGSALRSAGDDHHRNGSSDPAARNGAEADSATGARPGLGDDSGEIHSSPAGRRRELNARNYRIRAEDRLGDGSLKQKFRDNIAAIRVLRQLQLEDRSATDDEKRLLVKYVGWGGIPQVFASPPPAEWRSEGEELKALLTPDEYEAARASTLNAHYTSATVISGIYDAVERIGFDGGRVLEPALGIGHFFGLMPEGDQRSFAAYRH